MSSGVFSRSKVSRNVGRAELTQRSSISGGRQPHEGCHGDRVPSIAVRVQACRSIRD